MPITLLNSSNSGNCVFQNNTNRGSTSLRITTVTDLIRAQLTTNLTAYNSAAVNDWVKVTSTEYTNVFNNVPGVTKKGNTDIQVATRAVAAGFTEMQFSINNNTGSALTIDTNEYAIGFVAETWNSIQTVQFGYTTTYHTGAPTYGNSVSVTPVGACYYVRKAPTGIESAPATQTLYPSLKINAGTFNLVPNTSGWYTTNGGTTWLGYQGNASNGAAKFQMLVTSTKSW
jgi:O6-methylguanine-DNA--protein-cysteine methyltransferase